MTNSRACVVSHESNANFHDTMKLNGMYPFALFER